MSASKTWILLTALSLFLISGCSGIRVSQDFSPQAPLSEFSTYDWDQSVEGIKDRTEVAHPLVLDRIRQAVEQTLSEKGWTRATDSPHCRVAYDYIVESKISSTQTGPRFGIAMGRTTKGGGGTIALGSSTDIDQYDEGQVLIDILDVNTGKLLWRGKGTFRVSSHLKPEKMTQRINTAVEKILNQFPPK